MTYKHATVTCLMVRQASYYNIENRNGKVVVTYGNEIKIQEQHEEYAICVLPTSTNSYLTIS